jgi:hypothetical protein
VISPVYPPFFGVEGAFGAPEGGDVLFGVEKQQLERLYQTHLADEDHLQKVGSLCISPVVSLVVCLFFVVCVLIGLAEC